MKYLKDHKTFKETELNEGFMDLIKSTTGAFKSFLTGIAAPFKNIKSDFQKGLKVADAKVKISTAMDGVLKANIDGINKAEDEAAITNMVDAFNKEVVSLITQFDTDIKAVKESKLFESVVKDGLIGGRVMFQMLKDELAKKKMEFDKNFAAAKDLAAKKTAAINGIKTTIDSWKNLIKDDAKFKIEMDKYKTDNKIVDTTDTTIIKSYGVEKIEDLVEKEVSYKMDAFDDSKKREEQPNAVANGIVKKIENGMVSIFNVKANKEFKKPVDDILAKIETASEEEDVETKLKNITDVEQKAKISKFIDTIKAGDLEKIGEIDKLINPSTTA
jgi:hypothetical protein